MNTQEMIEFVANEIKERKEEEEMFGHVDRGIHILNKMRNVVLAAEKMREALRKGVNEHKDGIMFATVREEMEAVVALYDAATGEKG